MIGRLIGNFRIVTELGGGAMGKVYLAEHILMQRRCAIKVIRDELSTQEEAVHRFINEARLVNRIGHPNIVEITDFGQFEANYYIMMELLEGETLEDKLTRVQRMDEPAAVQMIIHVADALRAAHELGVVHRDLKPENIYLANKTMHEGAVVKVLDFGIAKLMHTTGGAHNSTSPGAVLGTPQYMSPEQCQGDEHLDHRSDVYSLGVVLYRMLTGSVPYRYDSVIQIMNAHIHEPPVPPRQLRPELSLRVEAAILKAMAKDPAHRFTDMLAFRGALEGRREPTPPPSPPLPPEVEETGTEAGGDLAANETSRKRTGSRLAQIVVDRIHKDKLVLPMTPTAARTCLSLLDSPVNSLDKVAKVIATDPIIAPQVLRRARSALLGARSAPVKTIDQAVSRLGSRELRGLIVDLSARQLFESKNPAIRRLTKNLWQHSVATGVLARALAKRRKNVDPEVAYLAGLLHDVGKPIAAALLLDAERNREPQQEAWMGADAWMSVVNECQREVGVALARAWNLQDEVLFAIARCDRYSQENSPASIVCFANALAKRVAPYPGQVDTVTNDALLREGQALLKLDDAMVESLVVDLRKHGSD